MGIMKKLSEQLFRHAIPTKLLSLAGHWEHRRTKHKRASHLAPTKLLSLAGHWKHRRTKHKRTPHLVPSRTKAW